MDDTTAGQLRHFGDRLRRARQDAKLTQEQFAEACDLSVNYISNLERGMQEPGLIVLGKLAAGLGVRASALLRRAGM